MYVMCRLPFFKQIVPTVDMVRYQFLMSSLINAQKPVMLVGPVGTGKTSVAESTLGRLDTKSYNVLGVNMSAQVRRDHDFSRRNNRLMNVFQS